MTSVEWFDLRKRAQMQLHRAEASQGALPYLQQQLMRSIILLLLPHTMTAFNGSLGQYHQIHLRPTGSTMYSFRAAYYVKLSL